jgi:hypothetical protein
MVLVFDMFLSLWRQVMVPISKHWISGFIPETGITASNFQAAYDWNSRHTSR